MIVQVHRSAERGGANHGWLETKHSFSFADYHNHARMNFGALRVLNDDTIAPSMGFDPHFHKEMEIVTIVLDGQLKHEDNAGNFGVISENEVQMMTAGSGIVHSEFNPSEKKKVSLLQIWVLPKQKNAKPAYGQAKIEKKDIAEKFGLIISPKKEKYFAINQDAYFYLGDFSGPTKAPLKSHSDGSGFFIFVIEGGLKIGKDALKKRDSAQITGARDIEMDISKNSKVLVIEVPVA